MGTTRSLLQVAVLVGLLLLLWIQTVNAFVPTTSHHAHIVAMQLGQQTSSYLETIRDELKEQQLLEAWEESKTILKGVLGEEDEISEEILAKIYNWKAWATVSGKIARRFITVANPDPSNLNEAIHWLQSGPLALPDNVVKSAILNYPNVYLIDPQQTYKQTLSVAPDNYRDPSAFRESLLEDPGILACTYNCIDEGCASECGNCWVTYKQS